MIVNYQMKAAAPTVFVTKGRQRVKQYPNRTIYLKNGEEFELELFNPTTNKVLAKISLNGKTLGNSGIVLRPGERVFLERYFDEAKKFLFETYDINSDDAEAIEAVKMNGSVEVEFFTEYIYIPPSPWTTTTTTYYSSPTVIGSPYYGHTSNQGVGTARGITPEMSSFYHQNVNEESYRSFDCVFDSKVETGRVEKGSNSNQNFNQDYTQFNSYPTWTENWKILPESQRPYFLEDLKVFCTNCGAKRKKSSHKFCPNCGTQF